jgi:hypothetical protein
VSPTTPTIRYGRPPRATYEIIVKYVGSHELAFGISIAMTLNGDQFLTQLTGQAKFEVFPESETTHFLIVVDAQLTFETDSQGNVTDVILHQNGMTRP